IYTTAPPTATNILSLHDALQICNDRKNPPHIAENGDCLGRRIEREVMIRAGQRPHYLHRLASNLAQIQAITFQRQPSILETRRRSEEHTSELQSRFDLVCRLLLE